MMVLFTLPADIWREKIIVFLMLKDIARASTAFSEREVQEQFRALTDGHTLQSPMSLDNKQIEMVNWCLSRNILPDSLLQREKLDQQLGILLPKVCARATKLSFNFYDGNAQPLNCIRLQTLRIYGCSLATFGNMVGLSNLTSLSVSGCPEITTDALIECAAGCKQLKTCDIQFCESITERAITFILNECRHLESLQLSESNPSNFNLATILKACNHKAHVALRKVDLSGCVVCSIVLQNLAAYAPFLDRLSLCNLKRELHDEDVDNIAKYFTQLKDLALNRFTLITSASMKSIAHYLPHLQKLCVFGCGDITDDGVIAIANRCSDLESLSLTMCDMITDKSVREIWQKCILLNNLQMSGCAEVTDAAFADRTSAILSVLNVNGTMVPS